MSAPLRIAVRADASVRIGTGHLVRCVSLARALRETGAMVRFITRDLGLEPKTPLHEFASECVRLPPPSPGAEIRGPVPHAHWAGVDWERDAAETVAAASPMAPTHLIVDHYAFDARWHRYVAAKLGVSLVIIDDLADRPLEGDLLVDHNATADHRAKYGANWPRDRPMCAGPRFALLDPCYANVATAEIRDEVTRIGIFMGGADSFGHSLRVLQACRELAGFVGEMEIVTTHANPRLADLQAACDRWPRTRLLVDLPELATFHSRHDIEIGAGGGSAWERCCTGVPSLVFATADNQRIVIDELVRLGAAATTRTETEPDAYVIAEALRDLLADRQRRQTLAANARRLVDGQGAIRVALRIAAPILGLRRAAPDDARMIHAWRNHPVTRTASADSAEISWETHRIWFERVLADPARALFVACVGPRPVGVIRFDRRDDGYHEISLFLDPALHGLGLGPRMLAAGEATMGADARFRARVVEGNERSAQMFSTAGYMNESPGLWLKIPQPPSRGQGR